MWNVLRGPYNIYLVPRSGDGQYFASVFDVSVTCCTTATRSSISQALGVGVMLQVVHTGTARTRGQVPWHLID